VTIRTWGSFLLLIGLAAGCGEPAALGPPPAVTAMTRNVYVGADVDVVIAALISPDTADDLPALTAAMTVLQHTDFPTRAEALADEIARTRPHVIGLQEVEQLHFDLTGLGTPASINQDFLAILSAALAHRGLHYVVAGRVTNITAFLLAGALNLTDEDVVLVDADRVTIAAAAAHHYAANLGVVAPGVELRRGWVQIDVLVDGARVTVASTHLEAGSSSTPAFPALRAAQAAELVAAVRTAPRAILLGDLNDTQGSPMYTQITGAGFTDTWAALEPGEPGLTCCEPPDLSNSLPLLFERIDYVFVHGMQGTDGTLAGDIEIVGDEPADRVQGPAYPIWPSDHAGVVARLGASAAP
jgi:endonuclease/exonuclease/phosphatase family metal-dependent hydrolase